MFDVSGVLALGIVGLVVVLPVWKIFAKAGFSGERWFSLGMAIPLVNIITLFYLASADWPVRRELDRLKAGTPRGSGSAAGMLTCPQCSTAYNPTDYRSDVRVIICSTCKAELPRPEAL